MVGTMWGPIVKSWFIPPSNHGFCSYQVINQRSPSDGGPHCKSSIQDGAPPVISWFIIPLTMDISTISPSEIGVINQLS